MKRKRLFEHDLVLHLRARSPFQISKPLRPLQALREVSFASFRLKMGTPTSFVTGGFDPIEFES